MPKRPSLPPSASRINAGTNVSTGIIADAQLASQTVTDTLSATFAALADPTRRAMLNRLCEGVHSVKLLAEPFAMSAPAITKHLKVLERAGLISRGRDAQWRPCKLEAAPLREASAWMEQYRRHWEARLDRLDDFLGELQRQMQAAPTAATATTATATTDTATGGVEAEIGVQADSGSPLPAAAAAPGAVARRTVKRRGGRIRQRRAATTESPNKGTQS